MVIIGISFTHDGTITIVRDGKVAFAIGEERLNRRKSYIGFPFEGLRYVIAEKIITPSEVSLIAIAAGTFSKQWARTFALELTEDKKYYDFQNEKQPGDFFLNDDEWKSIKTDGECRLYVEKKIRELFNAQGITAPIKYYKHHLCHAASAYWSNEHPQALAITLDGEGDSASGSVAICNNGSINTLIEFPAESSIGYLYSAVTQELGFKTSRHEGKITGLAAYGNPDVTRAHFEREVQVKNGVITFGRAASWRRIVSRIKAKLHIHRYYVNFWQEIVGEAGIVSKEDLSAGVQYILEKRVTELVDHWVKKTGISNIVTAGGILANVKLNQRIAELASVASFRVHPDMGDGGNAYGAAMLAYQEHYPDARPSLMSTVYFGPEYSDDAIEQILRAESLVSFKKSNSIAADAAQYIADGKIIGWFQGRMEYGPRALGNRSILACATDKTINTWLNERMKRTEFMPFAPSCLAEAAHEVFIIPKESMVIPARFMTITFNVKDAWAPKVAAITHVDGTARPQLVRKEDNPLYHELLSAYRVKTGLPLCINTSFNVHEEPIICAPEQALRALTNDVIDVLAIGSFIVEKK